MIKPMPRFLLNYMSIIWGSNTALTHSSHPSVNWDDRNAILRHDNFLIRLLVGERAEYIFASESHLQQISRYIFFHIVRDNVTTAEFQRVELVDNEVCICLSSPE